jgi:hypothetical protein
MRVNYRRFNLYQCAARYRIHCFPGQTGVAYTFYTEKSEKLSYDNKLIFYICFAIGTVLPFL